MDKQSDTYLISKVVMYNDQKAFARLVERHQQDIRLLLLKLTGGDRFRADDLAQETFLKAYYHLRSFQAKAKFSTWLHRIAWRNFLDAEKKRHNHQDVDEMEWAGGSYETESQLHAQMDADSLMQMLRPKEKVALYLSYGKGLPHAEIAEVMECPLGTVKTHIKRGRERIRKYVNVES